MKVERAKLVERRYEPHFALGLLSQSVDQFFQEVRGSQREETTDQVARC